MAHYMTGIMGPRELRKMVQDLCGERTPPSWVTARLNCIDNPFLGGMAYRFYRIAKLCDKGRHAEAYELAEDAMVELCSLVSSARNGWPHIWELGVLPRWWQWTAWLGEAVKAPACWVGADIDEVNTASDADPEN